MWHLRFPWNKGNKNKQCTHSTPLDMRFKLLQHFLKLKVYLLAEKKKKEKSALSILLKKQTKQNKQETWISLKFET